MNMSTEVLQKALEHKGAQGLEEIANLVDGMNHMPAPDAFKVIAIIALGSPSIYTEIEVELVRRRIQQANRPANRP